MATQFPPKGDADKKIGAYEAPLSVSAQDTPNMTVKVRAGAFFNSENEFVEYAGGNSPTITAPVGTPKWVVVGVTNAGTLTVINGTPAGIPSLPAVPAGVLPLAAVFVTPTTTSITPALIVDVRPFLRSIDVVPNLSSELADRPTNTDLTNAMALKADVGGTPSSTFVLNADFTTGAPGTDASVMVSRGAAPSVGIRWNESVDLWELTNDGVTYSPIASVAGTFAPLVHTHVAADVTDFNTAVNALIALATIPQSQVTGLVADLAAKANTSALTAHTGDATIHFTLPIAQSDVTGLTAALAAKANATGGTMTGNLTVQSSGNQPITLASVDAGSSGLIVDRTSVPGPAARLEWDESLNAWLVGTTGSMNTVLTSAVVSGKVDTTTQVIAGTGLSGGGALTGNVTLSMPSVGTPVTNSLVKITTDAQGRVSSTSAVAGGDLPSHTHIVADVTGFAAAAAAAAPVQSVNGDTGAVVLTAADVGALSWVAAPSTPSSAGTAGQVAYSTPIAATAGRQDVTFTSAKAGGDSTGLLNDATVYTASVVVDGGGAQPIAVTGSAAQTFTALLAEINNDLTGAVASLVGGNIRITSSTTGATSTVAITDTDLFNSLTDYNTIPAAVAGTAAVPARIYVCVATNTWVAATLAAW